MRKYTGLWGDRRWLLLAALLAAGCASKPKSVPVTEPAPPPPADGAWMPSEPAPVMRESAPLTYVVKKGDTLWDIASRFLLDPWQWPEIWVVNNQVRNPHLIYPGDTLTLVWKDGRPGVTLSGAENALYPRIRESGLDEAIPTIPIDAIRDFLKSPRMVTDDEIDRAPYVIDFVDPHLRGGAGNEVYVRNLHTGRLPRYAVVRLGQRFVDPESRKELGWEAIPIGDAEVQDLGSRDVAGVALLTATDRESRVGDYLVEPQDEVFSANFHPRRPGRAIHGRILSVFDGVSQIGQYQVVTLSRGADDGLEPGHVLSILQAGRTAKDPRTHRKVDLPDAYAGLLMVFKTDTRVSYALVMKAIREIHVLDHVVRPTDEHR